MGQAKLRRQQVQARLEQVRPAAARVGEALRKLAQAASAGLGSDCYLHAVLGRELLADLGVATQIVAGHAAWRIGSGDSDVMAHKSNLPGYLPEGAQGFAYHVWLETVEDGGASPILIDLTTYQLRQKAQQLDQADGGHTQVDWCPEHLVLRREDLRGFKEVEQAPGPGLSYYERVPGMLERLSSGAKIDQEDLALARLILASPGINVMGPNQTEPEVEPVRYRPIG